MKLSANHLSIVIIGVLVGLAMLPIGQIVECNAMAGTTTALKCADGSRISGIWPLCCACFAGTGIAVWILRNNTE